MVQEFAENLRAMTDEQFREFMIWVVSDLGRKSETSPATVPAYPREAV